MDRFLFEDDIEKMKEYHKLRRMDPGYAPRNYEAQIIAKNGVFKPVCLTVAMIPDTKKSMVSVLDMTELQKSKMVTEESRERFKSIFENAAEAIILFDRYGTIIEANDKIEKISGFKKEELIGRKFMKLLFKVDIEYKKALMAFKDLISGNELKQVQWAITNKAGKKVVFLAHPSLIKNNNKIEGLILIIEDITERINAENNLRDSLDEKEILLREIHHRVKNNLQIISSLLSLQKIQVDDSKTVDILMECQGRVRTMAMIHENLYQSKDISSIDFEDYLKKLLMNIFNSYRVDNRSITLNTHVECLNMGIETAMPCGLIINELTTNSIKHAFPNGEKGNIMVDLKFNNGSYVLVYSDDGIGMPENLNPKDSKKRDAVNSHKSQVHLTRDYLQSFVRVNDLLAIYPDMTVSKDDGNLSKGIMPSASYKDERVDYRTLLMRSMEDLTSAGITYDDQYVYLVVEAASNMPADVIHNIHLRVSNGQEVKRIDISVKDGVAQYQSKASNSIVPTTPPIVDENGDMIIVKLPKSIFAGAKEALLSVDVADGETNNAIDIMAWREFDFPVGQF